MRIEQTSVCIFFVQLNAGLLTITQLSVKWTLHAFAKYSKGRTACRRQIVSQRLSQKSKACEEWVDKNLGIWVQYPCAGHKRQNKPFLPVTIRSGRWCAEQLDMEDFWRVNCMDHAGATTIFASAPVCVMDSSVPWTGQKEIVEQRR